MSLQLFLWYIKEWFMLPISDLELIKLNSAVDY